MWVREDDQQLWERAEQLAKARRITLSSLLANALERYLDAEQPKGSQSPDS